MLTPRRKVLTQAVVARQFLVTTYDVYDRWYRTVVSTMHPHTGKVMARCQKSWRTRTLLEANEKHATVCANLARALKALSETDFDSDALRSEAWLAVKEMTVHGDSWLWMGETPDEVGTITEADGIMRIEIPCEDMVASFENDGCSMRIRYIFHRDENGVDE